VVGPAKGDAGEKPGAGEEEVRPLLPATGATLPKRGPLAWKGLGVHVETPPLSEGGWLDGGAMGPRR
jgi:hypothetical protein